MVLSGALNDSRVVHSRVEKSMFQKSPIRMQIDTYPIAAIAWGTGTHIGTVGELEMSSLELIFDRNP